MSISNHLGFFKFESQRVEIPKPGARQSVTAIIRETCYLESLSRYPGRISVTCQRSGSVTPFSTMICIPQMADIIAG